MAWMKTFLGSISILCRRGSVPTSPVTPSDASLDNIGQMEKSLESQTTRPTFTAIPSSSVQEVDLEGQDRSHHHHIHFHHKLKRWPQEPRSLQRTPIATLAYDIYDVILCAVPTGLMIKAGLCVYGSHIDEQHVGANFDLTSDLTKGLVRFNMQLTTLFTIIFVLIIATTVKRLALWKAQKGAKLSHLEQFQNSISLTATVKTIWSLRAFSVTSLCLLFVWSWYYVGSQASEREFTFQESGPRHRIHLAYIHGQATSPFADTRMSQFPTVKREDMIARYHTYVSRVQTGISTKPYDINGYPLTPFYDNVQNSRLNPSHRLKFDSQGWLDTTVFSLQHVVTAIGTIMYSNLRDAKSSDFSSGWYDGKVVGDFTYESTHFLVNCSDTVLLNQTSYPGALPTVTLSLNMTLLADSLDPTTARTFNVWDIYNATHSLQSTCSMTLGTVDVKTTCTAAGCKATAVRPKQNMHYPSLRTPFDDDNFASEFFNALLTAYGVPATRNDLTDLEADVGYSLLKAQLKRDQSSIVNTSTDLKASAYPFFLSISLMNHINTFYDASVYMKYDYANEQQLIVNPTFAIDPSNGNYTFIQFHGAEVSERYQISLAWVVADMLANFVLLLSAILAFWLRRQTLAPDVFGYVSSLTRDNPHIQLPEGGSTLSGMERARMMKHVKVKFGDVMQGDGVGRVAMTHAAKGDNIRRLDRRQSFL